MNINFNLNVDNYPNPNGKKNIKYFYLLTYFISFI